MTKKTLTKKILGASVALFAVALIYPPPPQLGRRQRLLFTVPRDRRRDSRRPFTQQARPLMPLLARFSADWLNLSAEPQTLSRH